SRRGAVAVRVPASAPWVQEDTSSASPPQLRPHHGVAGDDPNDGPVLLGREGAAPLLLYITCVGIQPHERDLIAIEEAPQLGAGGIPPASHDDCPGRWRVGRNPLKTPWPRHPVARQPSDLLRDLRRHSRDRVVVRGLDAHDSRRLGGTESNREQRTECYRHLAEDVARPPLPDDAVDPVYELGHLDTTIKQREQRRLVAFMRGVLTRSEADVRGNPR